MDIRPVVLAVRQCVRRW